MADLAALRELRAWMRDENIVHARLGKLELRLGPAVPPSESATLPTPAASPLPGPAIALESPDDDERHALETLLHSSGADVDMFLRARRKEPA